MDDIERVTNNNESQNMNDSWIFLGVFLPRPRAHANDSDNEDEDNKSRG